MHTIGQQLEEARKHLGLSLREAAEATKVRGDILLRFENDDFDFDLPEVYKRGFLRLYARFLKLDTHSVMQDYATRTGLLKKPEKAKPDVPVSKQELLGQLSLGDNSQEADVEEEDATAQLTQSKQIQPYIKIAAMSLGVVAAISALIWALGSPSTKTNPQEIAIIQGAPLQSGTPSDEAEESITLIASGDVYVVVRQEMDKQKLFVGSLKKGEKVHLNKKGPIKIQHTQGENLILEKEGQRYAMSTGGLAVSQFN